MFDVQEGFARIRRILIKIIVLLKPALLCHKDLKRSKPLLTKAFRKNDSNN